jgi:hypothetical protein
MAKLPSSGFTRPKSKDDAEKERELDELFEKEAGGRDDDTASQAQSGVAAQSKLQKSVKVSKTNSEVLQGTGERPNGKELRSAFPSAEASEQGSGFDINMVLTEEVEPEGFVKRNFSIKRVHMNRIKELTVKANNRGHRATQDDIINSIFDDFFRNKKV